MLLAAPACALAPDAGRAQASLLSPTQVAWVAANPVVDFAAIPDQRPMSYIDRGRYVGMAAALLQRASEEVGLSFRPVTVAGSDDAGARLGRGELDLIPAAWLSRSWPAPVHFTRPIMLMRFGLYDLVGAASAAAYATACRRVGVPAGYEQLAASLGPAQVAVPVATLDDAVEQMAHGAIAAVAMPRLLTDAQRTSLQATWFGEPDSPAWSLQALLVPGAGVALSGLVVLGWALRRRARSPGER